MKLLGIDLETGSPFSNEIANEDKIITEIGAVLYDTVLDSPVKILSEIINEGHEVDEEAAIYTGIDTKTIASYGANVNFQYFRQRMQSLKAMVEDCDYIVAHNGLAFDKPVLAGFFKRYDLELPDKTWIDTMIDVEYPSNCINKNLTYLQCFHGFAYPGHRAVFDILAMFRVMLNYDLTRIIENAESPMYELTAVLTYPNRKNYPDYRAYDIALDAFNEKKDLVKKAGFRWNPEDKKWTLTTKKTMLKEYEFEVIKREINED